jgi:hypothetical protein
MTRVLSLLSVVAVVGTSVVTAQSIGVAPHVGTMGLGADVGISVNDRVGVRVGANLFPITPSITLADIKYEFDIPSPQLTAMVDLFLVGGLRLSGGARLSTEDPGATGTLLSSVDIGNVTYTAADVGTLSAVVATNELAPYLGIGFGNIAKRGLGFILDFGLAFHGKPEAQLAASGPISTDPTFQTELQREEVAFEDDINWVRFYPVVSIGVSFGF